MAEKVHSPFYTTRFTFYIGIALPQLRTLRINDIVDVEFSDLQYCIECWINNQKMDKYPFQYLTVEDIETRSMIKVDDDFYQCAE
jgi:hypothetical protein